jgi:hypothetical protein
MIKKKPDVICYNATHEIVAIGEVIVTHIPMRKNLANLFAKVLYGPEQ